MINSSMLSARSVAKEVAAKRLSPQDALNVGTKAMQGREHELHAYVAEKMELTMGSGPLSGIGIGVKDIFDTHDLPTEYGSAIYNGHQPASDASLVTMLKNAGATVTGKTMTTEFAWFTPSPTRNPHNLEHTPGGSSSGSAAGVAAGYFAAAIGSQTGGSMIRPAAFCGVAGYKPSFRLFPTVGMKQFSWSLDTPGFFAASVADAAFVAAGCSGRDLMVDEGNHAPPRIGIYKSTIDHLMDTDMKAALSEVAEIAKAAGAEVVVVEGPGMVEKAREAHGIIQDFEARIALGDELARFPEKLSDALRDYLQEAASITPEQYDAARRTANHARKVCHCLFENCDVLLLPSAPGTAPHGLESTGDSVFNRLWTLMGVPAVNVPGMVGDNGLPLGMQILAPFGKDKRALQAGHWLECVFR